MAHEDVLQGFKLNLGRILDLILKYLPDKSALYFKEQIAKLENQNADLKEELAKAVANSLNDNIQHYTFEDMAKQVASHFADVGDRIANGDRDFRDLLDFCDVDKMIKDAEDKLKTGKEKTPDSDEKTLAEILKEEKPGIEFDEKDKKAIANELVARGYTQMIDYFKAEDYLQACLDGKIDLGVKICGSLQKGIFINPEYDETLGKNLEKTITSCEEYLGDTIRNGGDYFQALEECKSAIKDELLHIYIDRNITFEDVSITQDTFFMYGDMQMTFPAQGQVWFSYDKESKEIEIDFSALDKELTDFQKDAVQRKAYDVIDMQIEKEELEKEQQKGTDEIEEDPYGERTLF